MAYFLFCGVVNTLGLGRQIEQTPNRLYRPQSAALRSTLTVVPGESVVPQMATARSGYPSLLNSPIATEMLKSPIATGTTRKLWAAPNVPSPLPNSTLTLPSVSVL